MIDEPKLTGEVNPDFADLVHCLNQAKVEYLVVGAYAVAAHGHVRSTGDIDFFVQPTPENAVRVFAALLAFGAPVEAHGVSAADFSIPGTVYQIGLAPNRIDILTQPTGVDFDEAEQEALPGMLGSEPIRFIGLAALLKNKRAAARDKDLLDVRALEAINRSSK